MWLTVLLYLLPVSVVGEFDTALDLSSFCGEINTSVLIIQEEYFPQTVVT